MARRAVGTLMLPTAMALSVPTPHALLWQDSWSLGLIPQAGWLGCSQGT